MPPAGAAWSAAVGVLAMALYAWTLAPSVGWGDSADLALRMTDFGDSTFVDTPREYGFFRGIGLVFQLLPFGDAGTRANLMTAFFGALAVTAVAALTMLAVGSRVAGIASGLALTVSHTFWLLSVTAEVYTMTTALAYSVFFLSALSAVSQNPQLPLILGAIGSGALVAHHPVGVIAVLAAAVGLFTGVGRPSSRQIGIAISLFLICSSPVWWKALQGLMTGPGPYISAWLASPGNPFYTRDLARDALLFAAYVVYNFAGPSLVLIPVGVKHVSRVHRVSVMPAMVWSAAVAVGGITASMPDKYNVYVLVYPGIAVLVGVGLSEAIDRIAWGRLSVALVVTSLVLTPVVLYRSAPSIARTAGVDLVGARTAPHRENDVYFLWPPKHDDMGPRRFAESVLGSVDSSSVVIADYTLWRPLQFVQHVDSLRPDVELVWVERLFGGPGVRGFVEKVIDTRPVYLAWDQPPAYYQLDKLRESFVLRREGDAFRVLRK